MNRINPWTYVIIAILASAVLPIVNAVPIPGGISGNVYSQGELIDANILIENLNTGSSITGNTNEGFYSASLKDFGDNYRITANYQGLTGSATFQLSGSHKIDILIEDQENSGTVQILENPSTYLLEIDNPLSTDARVKLVTNGKDYGWVDAKNYPQQKIPMLIYDEATITIQSNGGETIVKKVIPKKDFVEEKIVVKPKMLKYTRTALGPLGWFI